MLIMLLVLWNVLCKWMLKFINCILSFSLDKALHSEGYKYGYLLPKAHLPNPINIIMVQAQKVLLLIEDCNWEMGKHFARDRSKWRHLPFPLNCAWAVVSRQTHHKAYFVWNEFVSLFSPLPSLLLLSCRFSPSIKSELMSWELGVGYFICTIKVLNTMVMMMMMTMS